MKQETLQLTGANYNGTRRALDFYPTPSNVTVALLKFLNLDPCTIWEPACGDGKMSEVLVHFGHTVISTDIRHTGYGKGGIDFLSDYELKCNAIITNPPFEKSKSFIEKAVLTAPLVCMLLKSQYWHARDRITLFEKMPPAYVLPLTWRPDFLEHERKIGEKGSPTMEVAWTVWIAGNTSSQYKPLPKP